MTWSETEFVASSRAGTVRLRFSTSLVPFVHRDSVVRRFFPPFESTRVWGSLSFSFAHSVALTKKDSKRRLRSTVIASRVDLIVAVTSKSYSTLPSFREAVSFSFNFSIIPPKICSDNS